MTFKLIYNPGPGQSNWLVRSQLKNEKIADKIKKQILELMVDEGLIDDTMKDGGVTVSAAYNFITVEIFPSKSSALKFKEITQDEFENKVDAESYFFGDPVKIGEPMSLKKNIKGIIDDTVRTLLPISDSTMLDEQKIPKRKK